MHKPTISLIISAYNEEAVIKSCLTYATQNSHERFYEILVINNASTDRTKEIALSVPGVTVIDEPRKGLTMARQCGYEHATGDLLAYIDADTQMPDNWLTTVESEFEKDKNLVCLSGPYTYFDMSATQNFFVYLYWRLLGFPMYLLLGYMAVGGNFVIKKQTLSQMNGFDTSISFFGEDTNIARRAHEFGTVKFNLSLLMPTSGRRLYSEGILSTAKTYVINFLSEAFIHKPVTKEYKDFR